MTDPHFHKYTLTVYVRGTLCPDPEAPDYGMVIDLGELQSILARCSTVDGTFLAFAPATNADRLMRWLQKLENDTARDIVQLPGCCSAGHPLEGENLLIAKDGDRRCRTCNRTRWRK